MDKKFDIVALGEILIDFTPQGKDDFGDLKFARKAGGAPLNLLACAAKFGLNTAFISKVGKDMFGAFLKQTAKNYGIYDGGILTDPVYNTTLAFVSLDESGDRDFSFYRNFGADIHLCKEDIDVSLIESGRIFHFGSLAFTNSPCKQAAQFAIEKAKSSGAVISYDPNYRPPLWESEEAAVTAMKDNIKHVDIAKLSKEEAQMITDEWDPKEAIKKLCDMGLRAVLITDGANGVNFGTKEKTAFLPSLKVKAVDTTGAGDIFFGTFLSCFVKSGVDLSELTTEKMEEFVKTAIEVAGNSTLKYGGVASIPDYKI